MARPASFRQALGGLGRFGRVFAPYVRGQWRLISGAMLALLLGTLVRVLEPWPLKFVIDRLAGYSERGGRVSIPAVNALDATTLLTVAAIALVVIVTLRAAAGYFSAIGFALAGSRALANIRAALFRHLQTLSLSFHQKARSGDLVVRMVGDIGMVQEVTVTAILPMLGNVLVLAGMFGVMLWLDTQLALIAIATLPVLWLATWRRGRRIHEAARRTRSREGAMAATAAESITAIKTVQSLSLDGRFADAFTKQNSGSLSEGVTTKRLSASLERGVDVLIACATALVLWFGARRVLAHELSPGELLVFLFYLRSAFRPMRDFAKYGARLAKASAAGNRIIEIFETAPEVQDAPHAIAAPPLQGEIRFDGVSFGYTPTHHVLHDIDLTIAPGTHVAIVGPSGSGKSTLSNLVLRLYDPARGRVLVDGHDVRDFTLASLRGSVSVVLQDTLLFATSIRENIAYGSAEVSDAEIEAAARLANAHDFISALPEGYDTVLGERGVTLSNGQRQRIAIARAAVRNSPILILDEPTTGLDRDNERQVLEALVRLARGRTTLHITHRPEAAAIADRVLYLEHGKLLEDHQAGGDADGAGRGAPTDNDDATANAAGRTHAVPG